MKAVGNLRIILTPGGYREYYTNSLTEILKGSRTRSSIIEAICNNIRLSCEIISNPVMGTQGKGVSQLAKELNLPGQEP